MVGVEGQESIRKVKHTEEVAKTTTVVEPPLEMLESDF